MEQCRGTSTGRRIWKSGFGKEIVGKRSVPGNLNCIDADHLGRGRVLHQAKRVHAFCVGCGKSARNIALRKDVAPYPSMSYHPTLLCAMQPPLSTELPCLVGTAAAVPVTSRNKVERKCATCTCIFSLAGIVLCSRRVQSFM